MKTYIKQKLLGGIIFGFGIIISIVGVGIIYSSWSGYNDLPNTNAGSGLTANMWNNMISMVNRSVKQDSEIISVDNTNGRIGIGTSSPSTKLEVNGTVKMTNLQVTNSPFTCQKIGGSFTYKGNIAGYGTNSCIKRAICPTGYLVTGCTSMDYPYYDSVDRIYNYLFPWFNDQNGVGITGEGCQWNNTFQNASTNNSFCDNGNFNVVAICCKMN